jgi:hypothetical protein
MSELDLWQQAGTLADLAELTARWLQGDPDVGDHPGYPSDPDEQPGPDPETAPLIPALVAANRAGLLTVTSQPGVQEHTKDGRCLQHAAVEGWTVDAALLADLLAQADDQGLLAIVHTLAAPGPSARGFVVTYDRGEPFTVMGRPLPREAVEEELLPDCGAAAVAQVLTGWFVTLIDPEAGRNDRLWPLLLASTSAAH